MSTGFERWGYRRTKLPPDPETAIACQVTAHFVGNEGGPTPAGFRHIKARVVWAGWTKEMIFVAGPQKGRPFLWGDLVGVLGVRAVSPTDVDLLALEIQSDPTSGRFLWRGITMRMRMTRAEVPDFVGGLDWQVQRRLLDWPESYRDLMLSHRAKVATWASLWAEPDEPAAESS